MSSELYGLITKEKVQVPLVGVNVHADIVGRGTKVKITQKFIRDHPMKSITILSQ